MRVLYISLVFVIIDQVTKLFVKGFSLPFLNFTHNGMNHGQRIPLIDDFFRLTFVENPGIAFGIDLGSEYILFISLFRIAATIALLIYLFNIKNRSFVLRLSLALIIGGAVGNLIDRTFYGVVYGYAPVFYGKVVDFIDIPIFSLFTFSKTLGNYVFNIADVAVTAGVVLLLIAYAREKRNSPEEIPTPVEVRNVIPENKE